MLPESNTRGKTPRDEPYCKELKRIDAADAALYAQFGQPPAPDEATLLPSLRGVKTALNYLKRSRGRDGSSFLAMRDVNAATLVDALFGAHTVSADKDLNAIIAADLKEYRLDRCAASGSAFGFDFDNSVADVERDVIEPLRRAGLTALVYHTHSHAKTHTIIDGDKYLAWSKGKTGALPPTRASVDRFLRDRKKIRHNVRFDVRTGLVKRVKPDGESVLDLHAAHDPVVSARVIVFPAAPVPIQGDDGVGSDGWKEIYKLLARRIWGDDALSLIDKACANVSTLLYLPAKPSADSPHQIWYLDGQPLDWRPLWQDCKSEIEERRARIAERREMDLPASASELESVLRSIPANCGYATWFRVIAAIHHEFGDDPDSEGYALAHRWSESAPALYDEGEIDRLWAWLDSSDYAGTPATMGTLIHLARLHDPLFRREADFVSLFL